jgi:hypothetical protein
MCRLTKAQVARDGCEDAKLPKGDILHDGVQLSKAEVKK